MRSMVKLQKRFAYHYEGKEGIKDHYKYVVTIPEELVKELKWDAGKDLGIEVVNRKLVLRPKEGKLDE